MLTAPAAFSCEYSFKEKAPVAEVEIIGGEKIAHMVHLQQANPMSRIKIYEVPQRSDFYCTHKKDLNIKVYVRLRRTLTQQAKRREEK